jgi:hypothetical protein
VEDLAVYLFGSKASLVMTNVAGSPQQLYLTGVPIERIMFWVPHPGSQLGMGISILSYAGSVSLGVVSDAHLVPDPEAIATQFNREFAAMLSKVNGQSASAAASSRKARVAPAKKAATLPAKRAASGAKAVAAKAAVKRVKPANAAKAAKAAKGRVAVRAKTSAKKAAKKAAKSRAR